MNIFSAISGFITGSPKVADDIFDKDSGVLVKVGGFINDLHLSDAERLKITTEQGLAYSKFVVDTMAENTLRSKTRRAIATKWIDMQIWLIKLTVLSTFIDVLFIQLELSNEMAISTAIFNITFSGLLWSITGGIGAFFFGTHLLRSAQDKKQ